MSGGDERPAAKMGCTWIVDHSRKLTHASRKADRTDGSSVLVVRRGSGTEYWPVTLLNEGPGGPPLGSTKGGDRRAEAHGQIVVLCNVFNNASLQRRGMRKMTHGSEHELYDALTTSTSDQERHAPLRVYGLRSASDTRSRRSLWASAPL